ncbi:MAG: hypothetical protein II825_01515 [Paludibacteraceae bacterium]|nr:hypothetical protein [Paludibacteraceae bacterium]
MKHFFIVFLCIISLVGCSKPSRVQQYKEEKHQRDSIRLVEQERSMAYYQILLDSLTAQADSLTALFTYERNEKYQDHGYFVTRGRNGLRILVRDDGKDLLLYREGKRVASANDEMLDRAQHLQIVIRDIDELEERIRKTSLEIQKYQKRLQ